MRRLIKQPITLGPPNRDPIHDTEAFINTLLRTQLDDWGMHITLDETDEIILGLLADAVELNQIFDPERNDSYAGYASWILRKRIVDRGPRHLLGRNGERALARLASEYTETTIHHRPHQPHTVRPSDTPRHSDPYDRWLDDCRTRPANWALRALHP